MELTPAPYHKDITDALNPDTACDMVIIKKGQSIGISNGVINSEVGYILFEPPTPISELKDMRGVSALELIARKKRK